MEKKINVGALREELKVTAKLCAKFKAAFREAQRSFSALPATAPWKERQALSDIVNARRSEADSAAMTMTRLCVYRAHLRGRKHLPAGAALEQHVNDWIAETEDDFLISSAA